MYLSARLGTMRQAEINRRIDHMLFEQELKKEELARQFPCSPGFGNKVAMRQSLPLEFTKEIAKLN